MAPKFRQIHSKTPESYDFNEIPTDFGRMFWLLLPVCLDSEGRGQDSVQWLRSKLFPIREDDVTDQIKETMDWLAMRGMIIQYEVNGRKYFYSVNFKLYQSGTDKEAPSFLPAPPSLDNVTPDLLPTNSGVVPDLVLVNAMQGNTMQGNAGAPPPEIPDTPYKPLEVAFCEITGLYPSVGGGTPTQIWIKAFVDMQKMGATPEDVKQAISEYSEKGIPISSPKSIVKGVQIVITNRNVKRNGNGKPKQKTVVKFDANGNPQEFPA